VVEIEDTLFIPLVADSLCNTLDRTDATIQLDPKAKKISLMTKITSMARLPDAGKKTIRLKFELVPACSCCDTCSQL
jgi:hypothetical protein